MGVGAIHSTYEKSFSRSLKYLYGWRVEKSKSNLTHAKLYLFIVQLNLQVSADLLLASNGSRGPVLAALCRVETKALDDSG